jgi:hypothetical protein
MPLHLTRPVFFLQRLNNRQSGTLQGFRDRYFRIADYTLRTQKNCRPRWLESVNE